MWKKLAMQASARDWNRLTSDEQSAIISAWTDKEGRIEMLSDCHEDILGLVVDLYSEDFYGNKRDALNHIGKMVCTTFAVKARKSTENLWKQNKYDGVKCELGN